MGEIIFLKREHKLSIQFQMIIPENRCTGYIIPTEQFIFSNELYTYMYTIKINEKGGHKFECQQGWVYGNIRGRDEKTYIIIL